MNECNRHALFFNLKRKKQVLALVLIEDLGFLPLVREIPLRSTRERTEFLTLVEEIPDHQ
jgi:hypothetical protein